MRTTETEDVCLQMFGQLCVFLWLLARNDNWLAGVLGLVNFNYGLLLELLLGAGCFYGAWLCSRREPVAAAAGAGRQEPVRAPAPRRPVAVRPRQIPAHGLMPRARAPPRPLRAVPEWCRPGAEVLRDAEVGTIVSYDVTHSTVYLTLRFPDSIFRRSRVVNDVDGVRHWKLRAVPVWCRVGAKVATRAGPWAAGTIASYEATTSTVQVTVRYPNGHVARTCAAALEPDN